MDDSKQRTFTIKHKGITVILETNRMKPDALKSVLSVIFHEFRIKNPEKLAELMNNFNRLYDSTLKAEAVKAAKKAGLPVEEEPEPVNDFDFWRELMESRWY